MRRKSVGVVRERPEGERAVYEPPLRPNADERPKTTETVFRAPGDPKEGRMAMEIRLKYETLRKGKKHGWIDTTRESSESA